MRWLGLESKFTTPPEVTPGGPPTVAPSPGLAEGAAEGALAEGVTGGEGSADTTNGGTAEDGSVPSTEFIRTNVPQVWTNAWGHYPFVFRNVHRNVQCPHFLYRPTSYYLSK